MSTTSRGYGWTHQQERKRWSVKVEAGACYCSRCGRAINPGQAWDLDHAPDRQSYLGPAHRACNRAAGARVKNARQRAKRQAAMPLRW